MPRYFTNILFFLQFQNSNELLGSVTQDSVRTSARVIQSKMQTSVVTNPMPMEKRETPTESQSIANLPKTPSQTKHIRIQWTVKEKKCFFDALNEHGRDFEQISRFVNLKMKRKNPTEADYKTKDHVRQHYYQLFQKASKYLKFSDDVKKLAQELYVLINYGEMKKKLIMSSEKSFLKLRDLVYRGSVTVRVKGKNIKIKTPSCRALKKLNQLEGTNIEDIQLPQRIDVYIRPSNLESWTFVQKISQNPRIKVSLTLQKRISSLISTLEQKWRSNNVRLQEKCMLKILNQNTRQKLCDELIEQAETDKNLIKSKEPHICFHPPENCKIFRPMIQLNELLSSFSICLNSYEVRIGAKKRSEEICMEKNALIRDIAKNNAKRVRNDSFSEKINSLQTESKKIKSEDQAADDLGIMMQISHENDSNDADMKKIELDADMEIDKKEICELDVVNKIVKQPKKSVIGTLKNPKEAFPYKPLINEEVIRKIREGWTTDNVGDLTIGDLYLMYGSDSKLIIEYKWNEIECQPKGNAIAGKLKHLMTLATLIDSPAGSSRVFEKNFIDLKEIGDNGMFKHPNNFHSIPNMNPRLKPHQWRSHQYRYRPDGIGDYFKNVSNHNHVVKNLYQTPSTSKQEIEKSESDDTCNSTQKHSDEVTKILEDKIQNLSKQPQFQCFSESSRSSIKSLLESLSVNSNKASSYEDNLASLRFWDNIHDKHSDDIDNISLSSLLGHLDSLNSTTKDTDD
jgi:hypothetical protein